VIDIRYRYYSFKGLIMNLTYTRFYKDERGIVIPLVALLLPVFLGIAALVVDLSILYVGKNELQKAADAGALAGARDLYVADGSAVNTASNATATVAATANTTLGNIAVEVNQNDVQRGHWSFGLGSLPRGFYPDNSTTTAVNLSQYNYVELEEMTTFINAVRVVTRRETILMPGFFVRIFENVGMPPLRAEAIGYLGYAGTLDEGEVDYPLAICEDSIRDPNSGAINCTEGNYLSGSNNRSGYWTNFVQPCSGAANAQSVSSTMSPCGSGNPDPIIFGRGITTMEGTQASSGFAGTPSLTDCWKNADSSPQMAPRDGPGNERPFPNDPWPIRLPVIDCNNFDGPTCAPIIGVVTVNVLWITTSNEHAQGYVPIEMSGVPGFSDWSSSEPDYLERWNDFAEHFNLMDPDGNPAPYEPFALYFHKDCQVQYPAGGTGGVNYGVMARIPVLVQ
jgi:Flp pilus assembly protein TadG